MTENKAVLNFFIYVPCPKNKTICLPHIMVSKLMKPSVANNHTKKIHFPGKTPICKDQQIDYFLLINNVPDFEMSIPFLNNLFLNSNSLFELSQSLLTNITIVPAHVANDQRYKLSKKCQIAVAQGANNSYHEVALRSL